VQRRPLSSVINFSEFIRAESDHTSKIEIVPGAMFYKCENLHKIWSRETICFKGLKRAIQHRFQTALYVDSA
jgi:hypothetical protein